MAASKPILALLATSFALAACARAASIPTPTVESASPTATDQPATETPRPTQSATPTVPSVTPTPACTEASGEVRQESYAGRAVSRQVPYLIYLPACYADDSSGHPVLYLLHGLPFDEQHWLDLGVVEAAETGVRSENWPPQILVMPLQPEPLFTGSDGGPGSYETEFMEGLLPDVEGRFRVDVAQRGIAGISRGGIWALEIAFRYPEHFKALAALSPALAVNSPRPQYDPFSLVPEGAALRALLLAGEQDWALLETQRLYEALLEQGATVELLTVPGDHRDQTWADSMDAVVSFFAEAWNNP